MELRDPSATHDGRERRLASGLAAVFAGIAVLAGADLAADLRATTTVRHVLVEGVVCVLGLGGFVWMSTRLRALLRETRHLTDRAEDLAQRLAISTREAERWRQEAGDLLAGLGDAIDRQLERWGLSQAEKEVALLLLKGLSHKQIGQMRNVAEATVRQQGRAIYQKAGLGGRHELAAFFLEDLLDPRPGPDSRGGALESRP
jgi:DNA-binding CsgD family transcriptional regulator